MTLSITKSNLSGFGSVPQDHLDGITDPDELMYYVPSSVEGSTINAEFTFTYDFSDEVQTYSPVSPFSISYAQPADIGIVLSTLTGNKLRVSGTSANVFPNSFYQFVMRDMSLKVLPPNTTEDYFYFVKYQMPSPTFAMYTYPISLTFKHPQTNVEQQVVADIKEYFYWSFSSAASAVHTLVASRP